MSLLTLSKKARDVAIDCPRKVVDSRQGKAVVFGSQEVGSPSQAGSITNGSLSTPCYDKLKYKNVLPVLN